MSTNNTGAEENKELQIANTNSAPETGSTESPNPDLDMPTFEDHLKASLLFRRPSIVQFLPRDVPIDEVEFQKYINISENKQRRKHDVQLLRKIAPRSIVIEKPAKRPYHRKNSTTTSLTLTPIDGSRPTAASTTATSSAPQGIPSTGIYNVGPRGPVLMVSRPPPTLKAVVPSGIMTSSPVMPFGIFPNTGSATYGQIKLYQGESTETQDVGSSLLASNSTTSMDSGAIHTDSIVRNAQLFNPRPTSMSLSRQLLQKPQFLPISLQNKFGSMSINNAENKINPMPSLRRILPNPDSSSSQASGSSNFGSNFYPPETQRSSSTLNPEHEVGAQALNLRHLNQEIHPEYQYGQNSNPGIEQWKQLAQEYKGQEMDVNFNNEVSYGQQTNYIPSTTQSSDQQMHSYAHTFPEIRRHLLSPAVATHPAVYSAEMDVLPTNQYLAIPPPIDPIQNNAKKPQEHFTGMQEPVGTNVDPNYIKRVEARLKHMKQQREQLKQEQQQINIGTSLEKIFECKLCWKRYYTLKQTMLHVSRHSEQEKQKYFEMARC